MGKREPGMRCKSRAIVACVTLTTFCASLSSPLAYARPEVCAGQPSCGGRSFVQFGSVDNPQYGANSMLLRQNSLAAGTNWANMDIPAGYSADIRMPDGGKMLARIWSADPTRIAGSLSANGSVYLYNQNGILFQNGAQVNVGSLVASALNIGDEAFKKGLLNGSPDVPAFTWEGDAGSFDLVRVEVEEGAALKSRLGEGVMLFAPRVANNGDIETPDGQAVLAAGAKVYVARPFDPAMRGFLVEVDPLQKDAAGNTVNLGGSVTNAGKILAERGAVTLAALAVNQMGKVSATTSVTANGVIRLLARDTVQKVAAAADDTYEVPRGTRMGELVFGTGSKTEVLPDPGDTQTIADSSTFYKSRIEAQAKTIRLQQNSTVRATGGDIAFDAYASPDFLGLFDPTQRDDGARIYVDSGAVLDISGTRDVEVAMERNFMAIKLTGGELQDAPLQRDGFLSRKDIVIDIREGSALADFSSYIRNVERSVAEKTATGGNVTLRSQGDIVLRRDSGVDVSGGSVKYKDGYNTATRLVDANGKVWNIKDATPDGKYVGMIGTITRHDDKRGVTRTWAAVTRGTYERGYIEGKDAGTASLLANALVLDGNILGNTVAGPHQRETAPLSSQLLIGNAAGSSGQYLTPDVLISSGRNMLPESLGFFDALPAAWRDSVYLSADMLKQGGIGRLAVYSEGAITLAQGTRLEAPSGGSMTLYGRELDVQGSIIAPGGDIDLASKNTYSSTGIDDPARYAINIGADSLISTAGQWSNDNPLLPGAGTGAVTIDGGDVTLSSLTDLTLASGSVIDVGGGAWLKDSGKVANGNGGNITLSTGRFKADATDVNPQDYKLTLGAELRGYAPGKGGKLSLGASRITVGGTPGGAPLGTVGAGELWLPETFFGGGGFGSYILNAPEGITVAAGAQVLPVMQNLMLDARAANRASGSNLADFSRVVTLPDYQRAAASLKLVANRGYGQGRIAVDEGARVRVDAGGSIALDADGGIDLQGVLAAPAGSIKLALAKGNDNLRFDRYIWLGASSSIDAAGTVVMQPALPGLLQGEVRGGGKIDIGAGGYLVAEQGARLDVSGTQALLDVPALADGKQTLTRRTVGSDAGSVALAATEGMLFDADVAGASPTGGGSFSAKLADRTVGIGYPVGERELTLQQSGLGVPAGLQASDARFTDAALADTFNGKAWISADRLVAGGFRKVQLAAENRIVLADGLDWSVPASLRLSAPNFRVDGDVRLAAPYVSLGNNLSYFADKTDKTVKYGYQNYVTAAANGPGTLAVNAALIDLEGNSAVQGAGAIDLVSTGDIRLKGVPVQDMLSGGFAAAGTMTLSAAQIYPTTLSQFDLALASGRLLVTQNGSAGAAMSAGGRLGVTAPDIEISGTLKAPFGEIDLDASGALKLDAGSRLSVSGEWLTVPFGRTDLSGRTYVYGLSVNGEIKDGVSKVTYTDRIIDALPEKAVRLAASDVSIDASAVLDVSGSGELYAYEFTAGPGGSRDVLAALDPARLDEWKVAVKDPGGYAIVPWLPGYAPFDHQSYLNSALTPGDALYLHGGSGLPAGRYALLPARYALLPGAYLVTPVSGYANLAPGMALTQANGSTVVAGQYSNLNENLGDMLAYGKTSGYMLTPGAVVRTRSGYTDTYAGDFFAGGTGRTTLDAGRLAVAATRSLALAGDVIAQHAADARGAELDIYAPRIAVQSEGGQTVSGDYARVDTAWLDSVGADSVLIGAERRHTMAGMEISDPAREIVVATDALQPLAAPEVMLAATDTITVMSGSTIESRGVFSGTPEDTVVRGTAATDADGAFLRVGAGAQPVLTRVNADGTPAARQKGDLNIEAGATVRGHAIHLDATRHNTNLGSLAFTGSGGYLALGAGNVVLGAGGSADSYRFSAQQLDALAGLSELAINSYGAIEVYGDVAFNNQDMALALDAAGIAGYDNAGVAASIGAGTLTLSNRNGAVLANAPNGSGDLRFGAGRIVIGAGRDGKGMELQGFAAATLLATEVIGQGSGGLHAAGSLDIEAGRITAQSGANTTIAANGALTMHALGDAPDGDAEIGGSMSFTGATIWHGGRLAMHSGAASFNAAGGVVIGAGAMVDLSGTEKRFADKTVYTPGGSLKLASASGDIVVESGALVDVSASAAGGDAGSIAASVPNGRLRADGSVLGQAAAGSRHGNFSADVGFLGTDPLNGNNLFSALNGKLNAGGFAGERSLRVRGGDVTVDGADIVVANRFAMEADGGKIDVFGLIDASADAGDGGAVELYARDNLTVYQDAAIGGRGQGAGAQGGDIVLGSAQGALDVQWGSLLDVTGGENGSGGTVLLRAPRSGNDVQVTAVDGTVAGAREVVLEAFRTYQSNIASLGIGTTTAADQINLNTVKTDTTGYMNTAGAAIKTRLGKSQDAVFHVRPGVEIRNDGGDIVLLAGLGAPPYDYTSTGNQKLTKDTTQVLVATGYTKGGVPGSVYRYIGSSTASTVSLATQNYADATKWQKISADWNLASKTGSAYDWRYGAGNEPGLLTLRAKGDVRFAQSISDGFTVASTSLRLPDWTLDSIDSWSYRITAGADTAAAAPGALLPMSVLAAGKGSVTLEQGQMLRTGSGFIDIAAGRDVVLNYATPTISSGKLSVPQKSVIYTAGKAGAALANFVVPQVKSAPNDAVFPSGGGDIHIVAQGNYKGAPADQLINDWLYRQGNPVATSFKETAWWPRFPQFGQGVGALGGGDIRVAVGGDAENLQAVIPTNGRVPYRLQTDGSKTPDAANAVVQGGGDLYVAAGGNIDSGIFYVGRGQGTLVANGAFGRRAAVSSGERYVPSTILALGDGGIQASAAGSMQLETIFNPTVAPQTGANKASKIGSGSDKESYFFTYTDASAAKLLSLSGDITLGRAADLYYAFFSILGGNATTSATLDLYPSKLEIAAPGGSIALGANMTLYPSAQGSLDLLAGDSVGFTGNMNVILPDLSPVSLPTIGIPVAIVSDLSAITNMAQTTNPLAHAETPLHQDDAQPVRVVAVDGDIAGRADGFAKLYFAKRAIFKAGGDIRDVQAYVQNLHDGDVSQFLAGEDIVMTGNVGKSDNRIDVSGPGWAEILAGGSVDLGTSVGILTKGNQYNPYLPDTGAHALVFAGLGRGADGQVRMPAYQSFLDRYAATTDSAALGDLRIAIAQELAKTDIYQNTDSRVPQQVLKRMQAAADADEKKKILAEFVADVAGQIADDPDAKMAELGLSSAWSDAWAEFGRLSPEHRALRLFYNELKLSGRAASDRNGDSYKDYSRGEAAVAALFPQAGGTAPRGDIDLFFSQIKTEGGGDILLLAPGGSVNAGLANPGSLSKEASELGIVTVRGGSIGAYVQRDFMVNQSRVFTLQGGNVLLWADEGDVDAGKGARNATATPAPKLVVRGGQLVLDVSNSISGSGIGVLLGTRDTVPGDVDLYAPRGAIDAGDAGVRSAGNIFLGGDRILNADAIQSGGISIGLPPVVDTSLAAGLSGVGNMNDALKATDEVTKSIAESSKAAEALKDGFRPSFITVEVIGMGES